MRPCVRRMHNILLLLRKPVESFVQNNSIVVGDPQSFPQVFKALRKFAKQIPGIGTCWLACKFAYCFFKLYVKQNILVACKPGVCCLLKRTPPCVRTGHRAKQSNCSCFALHRFLKQKASAKQ